jgi:hypothetical protein
MRNKQKGAKAVKTEGTGVQKEAEMNQLDAKCTSGSRRNFKGSRKVSNYLEPTCSRARQYCKNVNQGTYQKMLAP